MTIIIDARELPQIADRLSRSGPFQGASKADIEARLWIGSGLQIDPGTAASNIGFANGRPTFAASLQHALLSRAGWSARVDVLTDEVCELTFLREGRKAGTARFDIAEAKRAGLLARKDVWQKYPQDLLFARALTRGIRRLVPGLLVGSAAYTGEEVGEDRHEPIPAEVAPPQATPPQATPAPGDGKATTEQLGELRRLKDLLAISADTWKAAIRRRGASTARDLTPAQADDLIARLRASVVAHQLEAKIAEDDAAADREVTVDVPVTAPKEGGVAAGSPTKSVDG
jgi:hypothetical protein